MMVSAFTGCGFDEDPLQNRLNDIKNRIAALQSRIDEANKQVSSPRVSTCLLASSILD